MTFSVGAVVITFKLTMILPTADIVITSMIKIKHIICINFIVCSILSLMFEVCFLIVNCILSLYIPCVIRLSMRQLDWK